MKRNFYPKKTLIGLMVVAMVLLFAVQSAHAHRVNVFAWVQGDRVYVEGKFSGGRKVKDGQIIVTDADGVELLTGKTDDQGEFSFKIPQKTELKIVLLAGVGHRGEWTLSVEDLQTSESDPRAAGNDSRIMPAAPGTELQNARGTRVRALQPGLTEKDIQSAVEKALDRKLAPVFKMLAESRQQGPTASDILGGIGYILGLVGIGAYIHSRRKKD
jgi:nickel transport protein